MSDHQLRQLPPPAWPARVDQRPGVVALAVCLAVTAGLLWICTLSLLWLVAAAGVQQISPVSEDSYVFHTLDGFVLRMGDGLWLPLYGFPLLSVVSGFLLLARRPWTRVAHTAVGVAALGWTAWWLRDLLLAFFVVALYVGVAVGVLWASSVGRWYAGRPGSDRGRSVQLTG